MRKIFLIPALLGALAFAGCGEDAPTGERDKGKADVLNMPSGFANVAHKCDGNGNRVFSAGGSDVGVSVAVVRDPACGGGETTTDGDGVYP